MMEDAAPTAFEDSGDQLASMPTSLLSSPNGRRRMRASAADFAPGTLIGGRYRILRRLAVGAFGTVFLAEHETDAGWERIALKVLSPDLQTDAAVLEYFVAEAAHIQRVRHSSVVRGLASAVEADGTAYLVMEFIDGATLRQYIRRLGTLPLDCVLSIALQLAAALEACHAVGLVHRDLKPENVMIMSDGTVKLIDFGIARRAGGGRDPFAVAGTVHYMAPEQMVGESADERTDIFALGILIGEMLNGRRALKRGDPNDESPITHLWERMCARERADRPATMTEVQARLLDIQKRRRPEADVARNRPRWVFSPMSVMDPVFSSEKSSILESSGGWHSTDDFLRAGYWREMAETSRSRSRMGLLGDDCRGARPRRE